MVDIEVDSRHEAYPGDRVALVDAHAVAPGYSFLAAEDRIDVIHRVHSTRRTSVERVDGIKQQLARDRVIDRYSVRCANFGILPSCSTVIGTEKSGWVPFSGCDAEV